MIRKMKASIAALTLAAMSSFAGASPASAQGAEQIMSIVGQMARIAQQSQARRQPDPYAAPQRYAPAPYGYGDHRARGAYDDYDRAPRYRDDAYDRRREVAPSYAMGNLSSDPRHNCWIEMRQRPDRRTGRMVEKKLAVCEEN